MRRFCLAMLFCPFCGTLLLLEKGGANSSARFFCCTCPYIVGISSVLTQTRDFGPMQRQVVTQGESFGDGTVEGTHTTEARCRAEDCDSRKAFYAQLQMRSADEPPTTFFKCVKCALQWRED